MATEAKLRVNVMVSDSKTKSQIIFYFTQRNLGPVFIIANTIFDLYNTHKRYFEKSCRKLLISVRKYTKMVASMTKVEDDYLQSAM
jgi:hypothetical protein